MGRRAKRGILLIVAILLLSLLLLVVHVLVAVCTRKPVADAQCLLMAPHFAL